MVNRKVIASASAIILLIALGVAGDGGEEIFEYSARLVAEVTDINGQPIEIDVQHGEAPPSYEQLVEGHIVFHTMDIIPRAPTDITEINLEGLIECRYEVFGIGIPSGSIDRIYAECNTGGRIFTSDPNAPPPTFRTDLTPTGWQKVGKRPDNGLATLTVEYEYWALVSEPGEVPQYEKAYCWETTVQQRGTNPHTGKDFNWVMTLNLERLGDFDVKRLKVQAEEDFFTHSG